MQSIFCSRSLLHQPKTRASFCIIVILKNETRTATNVYRCQRVS